MVNSNHGLERGRKEAQHDLIGYIDELKNKLDIFQVAALHGIRVNNNGQAECFNNHDEKTPSLKFYEDTQTYHCFGCGSHGDAISLVQHVEGCSFMAAVNSLSDEAGMPPFENNNGFDAELFSRVSDCLNAGARIYHNWLTRDDPYLVSRGIVYETAQRFMIGHTRGREDLRLSLEAKGVTADAMLFSGLVKTDGTDFFQDHIVVPIISRGRVVDFYGRSLNGNQERRHWRLPNDRFKVGHGLFNWNPRTPEIILVEGVFDTLALIENGFPNAVATFGTQGLTNPYMELIQRSRVQKVFICYDGDASGRSASLRDGIAWEDSGKEVRIVQLPEDTDPNDFVSAHPDGEFQALLSQAPSPAEAEVERIKLLQAEEDKNKALDALLLRCQKMAPLKREGVINMIAKSLKLSKSLLRNQISYLGAQVLTETQVTQNLEEITDSNAISPALDIVDGTLFITVQRLMRNPDNGSPKWTPWVVTSNREWFPLEQGELHRRGYHTMADQYGFHALDQRYTPEVVRDFVRGKRTGDLVRTYGSVRETLRKYLDFPDPNTHDFLTAWIIGTYCYVMFNYYPYVHFNGTKLVGKSKALKLLACLSFNGIWCVSISEAAQFRLIEALQLTLCLDETEDLNQKQLGEKRALLLGGYEKVPESIAPNGALIHLCPELTTTILREPWLLSRGWKTCWDLGRCRSRWNAHTMTRSSKERWPCLTLICRVYETSCFSWP